MPLFEPLTLGGLVLPNRIVMAPLGRARGEPASREPTALVAQYYVQRASAGLIISEATHVSADSVSRRGGTAIHTEGQVAAWRKVADAVHEAGGRIFQQLFHLGRKADPALLPTGSWPGGPSAIAARAEFATPQGPKPFPVPRVLELDEIARTVEAFGAAAANARRAGFDGVEIHAANGYLIDQFLRDGANQRHDHYGGSVEGRARFLLEIVEATTAHWPSNRVGVRLSPHPHPDGTRDAAPRLLTRHVAERLAARDLAYLHLVEPAATAPAERMAPTARAAFAAPLIVCGGFDRASAQAALTEDRADLVAFGAGFIANPDLVERLRRDAPWNAPDPSTFYSGGAAGYVDYPVLTSAVETVS
ncbi:alkene reductase [Caulobacter soli]|uniref:alkene reductase n=1 Tax=Caulobacter soli TaxID=2708539 RepID=UPI0013EAF1C0|nr:alkene reductase [Caulobacter soli]